MSQTCPTPNNVSYPIYSLITAKKLLLTHWKKKDAPTTKLWLGDLTHTLHLEQIRYTLTDKLTHFEKIWSPLIQYLTLSTGN